MQFLKSRLVYIPSVGVKTVVNTHSHDGPFSEYYTLTYKPEDSTVSITKTKWRDKYDEAFNLKEFLVRIEDSFTDDRQDIQPERTHTWYGGMQPALQTWGKRMRKVKVAQRIPGSTEVRIRAMPAYSPLEQKVRELGNPMHYVHVLHLQPFQAQSSNSLQPSNDQSKFDNMTSLEMHDYFNQKMAEHQKWVDRDRERIEDDRRVHPSLYGSETVFGKQIAENPDSEIYDTDSEIEIEDEKP